MRLGIWPGGAFCEDCGYAVSLNKVTGLFVKGRCYTADCPNYRREFQVPVQYVDVAFIGEPVAAQEANG